MKDKKSLTIHISIDAWKKIKKMSIDNDVSLSQQASEILEKVMSNKKSAKEDIKEDN